MIIVSTCLLGENCKYNGVKQVYDGTFSGKLVEGAGIFAQALEASGIQVIDAEDI